MNEYYVLELPRLDPDKHTKEALEYVHLEPRYRKATSEEIIKMLEDKVRKAEKELNTLKQYLGDDMVESINELENYLHDNTMRKERWV